MKSKLIYVELASGFNHDGPAWIGRGFFSRTMRSVYFNGRLLSRPRVPGISSNYFDVETGEEYWVSGVKKRGGDRHVFGSGKIGVDKSILNEYLDLRGYYALPENRYTIVALDNSPRRQYFNKLENKPL